MSLRNPEAAAAPVVTRWPIATWLTVYYTIFVLTLLSAVSALLYWDLRHDMLEQDTAFLAHKMQVLSVLLQQRPFDRAGIDQEVLEEAAISSGSPTPFVLRVLGADSRLVAESPRMAQLLPALIFPAQASGPIRTRRHTLSGDADYLLASTVVRPVDSESGWRVQAALNITSQDTLLAGYRRDILAMLLFGVIAAVFVGAWLTRRGLKPIAQITRAAERIGAQQLHDRVQAGPWPRELISLASAFDGMLDRLQESFARLSQFSADLAHELRTPITNLMGEAQVILARSRSAEEYTRALHSALEEYGRLARMIDSMLFLAQADQARAALALTPLDAMAELRAVADFYQAVVDEENITLACEGGARIVADPMLLRRALSNLVSNAVRYTPPGGRITLEAQGSPDGGPILSVVDSGVGIAPEHLPKLGDRFYRVDPARSESAAGAGLGLAIVKSIMSLHGGQLVIESTPGKGTKASLRFQPI